jgi:hypothetical protein
MERRAKARRQPGLQTEVAVPDHALEKRVDERHDQRRRTQLRNESRTLGNPPEMIAGIAAKVSRKKNFTSRNRDRR